MLTPAFLRRTHFRGYAPVESSPRIRLGCSSLSLCIRLCITIAVRLHPPAKRGQRTVYALPSPLSLHRQRVQSIAVPRRSLCIRPARLCVRWCLQGNDLADAKGFAWCSPRRPHGNSAVDRGGEDRFGNTLHEHGRKLGECVG
jgi:hypothetical protein